MPLSPRPLLIASLGNPGAAYAHTLHSAGHTLLSALAEHLKYLPFARSRVFEKALVSTPYPPSIDPKDRSTDWMLWQSPSYMNNSGRPVSTAWKAWKRGELSPAQVSQSETAQTRADRGLLVLLHDELDRPFGQLKPISAGLSARGHNGVKSVQMALPKTPFVRIAIGIGRPERNHSKESGVISDWVLRKMTREEREKINGSAGECLQILKQLEAG